MTETQPTSYVTTPIYYVNGTPHLGHAYTTLAADVLARYWRSCGHDVHFLTGTDEHGLKVMRAAEKEGITPQAIADRHVVHFQKMNDLIGATSSDFIRTTEPRHKKVAQELWRRVRDAGDIYLGKYEGWYAASDEAYYKEDEIEDGRAIVSGAKVEWVVEESYFFKLSAYQERLLAFYEEHPDFIQPESRRNEVIRFVEGGLNDLSVSRTTFDWGIPVPDDPNHVMYVWFDALTNYISALGVLSGEENPLTRFWPAQVHLVGKDIVRFHAVFWPAFLMSAGIAPPKQIWAHGWWLVEKDDEDGEGEKMSKSKGNIVDPFTLFTTYRRDVLRYFLFREIPFGNDGVFSEERILTRNNTELANTFGNLVNRGLQMSKKFLGAEVPDTTGIPLAEADERVRAVAAQAVADFQRHLSALAFNKALDAAMALATELNGYIQAEQPWALRKSDPERLKVVLYTVLEGLRVLAVLFGPFMPETSAELLGRLGYGEGAVEAEQRFTTLDGWGRLPAGHAITVGDVLFPRIDEAPIAAAAAEQEEEAEEEEEELIAYEEFMTAKLKVAQVLTCEPVPKTSKLFKLTVDVGERKPRQIVSGLAGSYKAEELVGKRVVLVANLKPAKIRGVVSNGMLLAVDTAEGLRVVEPPAAPLGTRIS